MFDRWISDEPENGSTLLEVADQQGFGLITFSPLWQGQLTDKYLHGIPPNSRAARKGKAFAEKATHPATLAALRTLNELTHERGQSLAQMALAWNLRLKQVSSVLIGASSCAQIDDALACQSNLSFTNDELQVIDAAVSKRLQEIDL
jgi:L-glyceraldehyde 3-phosphate reductase